MKLSITALRQDDSRTVKKSYHSILVSAVQLNAVLPNVVAPLCCCCSWMWNEIRLCIFAASKNDIVEYSCDVLSLFFKFIRSGKVLTLLRQSKKVFLAQLHEIRGQCYKTTLPETEMGKNASAMLASLYVIS